jgi:hypothetical protein
MKRSSSRNNPMRGAHHRYSLSTIRRRIMPLDNQAVRAALKVLAQVRLGDKVRFGLSHGRPIFAVDRKGVFQAIGRHAADSISEVANQRAIANILMGGAEEVSCGRIPLLELQQALAGLANLTGSYQGGKPGSGKQQRHVAAGDLYNLLSRMVDDVQLHAKPCLALVPGRTEDLKLTARTILPAPFATWFEDIRRWLETDITGTNDDWKEHDSSSHAGHHEPDGTGTFVFPLLANNCINPQDSGYPVQVWKDDLDLTVGVGLAGGVHLPGVKFPTYTKNRSQAVPAAALEALDWATGGDRALVYAALLLASQHVLPGSMTYVAMNLTLLSSGVAIQPFGPGNIHHANEHGKSLHINTGLRSELRVTYNMELSQEAGEHALEYAGALRPVTRWTAQVAIETTLTRVTPYQIRFRLSRIRFKLQVSEV